jgi:hypothetical protein
MSGRVAGKNEVQRWVANRVLMHRRSVADRVVDRRLAERVITDPAAAKAPLVDLGGLAGTTEDQKERLCRAKDGWTCKGWVDKRGWTGIAFSAAKPCADKNCVVKCCAGGSSLDPSDACPFNLYDLFIVHAEADFAWGFRIT